MLPRVETPQFETTLPSTGEVIKFRPFLVKEEKILMLASESEEYKDMVSACSQIVENCTFEKVQGKNLTMYDMQDLFLRIREVSIGEEQEFQLICGECDEQTSFIMPLKELNVKGLEDMPSNEIKVGDDFVIIMKHPTVMEVVELESNELSDIELISKCIHSVVTEEETTKIKDISSEELDEFIDDLSIETMGEMRKYIQAMPVLEHTIDFTCVHCRAEQKVSINGYEHFFA